MKATCQCGSLTAEIADKAQPMMTLLCHCIDCQKRTGSPFGTIAYYPDYIVTLSGTATEHTRATDAGNVFTTGFCPKCGSTVFARASKFPEMIGVTVGTIADPSFPMPAHSVYEQSRHRWVVLPADIPRHPKGRDS